MYFSDSLLLLSFPKKQKSLSLYLSTFPFFSLKFLEFGTTWEQGWRSGDRARLPPMWPGFES